MMQNQPFRMLAFTLLMLLVCNLEPADGMAKTKRHLIIHGGLSVFNYARIAEKIDYLVVSNARPEHLAKMKEINPDLVILRYHHALGVRKNSPFWDSANRHASLIVRDRRTGKRMVEKKYGWYLLDVSSQLWRQHLTEKIFAHTPELFDGVFLDDFWSDFVDKFVTEEDRLPAVPPEKIITDWKRHLVAFLEHLQTAYPGLIFINGLDQQYIHHVDGCMEEGFVHGNWMSDKKLPNPAKFMRSVLKTRRIAVHGKTVLVQSGTRGDAPSHVEKLFRWCFSSYLMIQNEHTSFGFHPLYTYYFKDFAPYDDYQTDLGAPLGPYELLADGSDSPNLLPNADFSNGLQGWRAIAGAPELAAETGRSANAVFFTGSSERKDRIASPFITVDPGAAYRLAAVCRTEDNRPGSENYMKFGLQGRFYDRSKNKLAGAYDVKFDRGTYGWMPFERIYRSPAEAAYFRIRIGFIGDGTGKGWLDRVYLGRHEAGARLMRRYYSKGAVLVNFGTEPGRAEVVDPRRSAKRRVVPVSASDGRVVPWEETVPE